jgi:hypothetical protein
MTERQKSTLKVTRVSPDQVESYNQFLCSGYTLEGSFSLNDIADFIYITTSTHPDHILFATLDWYEQACYTSGNSADQCLDDDYYDIGEGEKINFRAAFNDRLVNFKAFQDKTTLSDIMGTRSLCVESEDGPKLSTAANIRLETFSYVQIVPVNHPADAIAALPNGYFSDDFSPWENALIARTLYDQFDVKLFGIGAQFLGFRTSELLQNERLKGVTDFITSLFFEEDEAEIRKMCEKVLPTTKTFFLNYTE